MKQVAPHINDFPKYWAECYGTAPYLPMSRAEMDELGWDSCDIILVVGDAYVDHPSFGMAVIGRVLEAQGFRVGIIAQPDWNNPADFQALGTPNLFFGVSAGNMDSMINRYTADLKVRNDDAYTPHGKAGKRPDRALTVYCQKLKALYKEVPIVAGGIEASLRRIAQYDHWSGKVRRSVLLDSGADIVLYGNAERAIIEIAHELAMGKPISDLVSIRGTALVRDAIPAGFTEVDSTRIDWPGKIDALPNPYEYVHSEGENNHSDAAGCSQKGKQSGDDVPIRVIPMPLTRKEKLDPEHTVIRLPSFEKVSKDPALYAHASRILHLESNPNNARILVQKHGSKEIWVNRPPIPLETDEMDSVFDLPYQRRPHPSYGDAHIPAYEMIKFSVNIMRGCFGGCTFCSITEHEGRVIQSRSEDSILKEIENIRDKTPGFTGTISDLGGPTANMYQLNCVDDDIQSNCRKLSCVYPSICPNLVTDHSPTTQLYRKARKIDGVKRVAIASGLRYDLAVEDPEYVKELVQHHVGGYLKIAPEHTESNTLDKMMKPGIGTYDAFKAMFDKFSKEVGKEQYLIPYFIAAHPGCTDEDMINLALWCKQNDFRPDQVQTFYPSPMALATAMYYSDRNPLSKVTYKSDKLFTAKELPQRQLHKALLRYHDPKNWPIIRKTLQEKGLTHLIGDGPNHLIPWQDEDNQYSSKRTHGKKAGSKKAGPSANKVKQTSSHKRAKFNKRKRPSQF
ncbi:YgiQ family radical SAM protein [Pleionea litopenaei]|uniref:YgiQ family radical SAM protein n=1 Tax=Pleionea litopenaei TaxID=3070815 RepID=A0AA51RWY5_9GAMM|nr:YgiQ family radical SAM protein [Pleionea sp. HL-JVS1]WMS88963.1 YgiQ family radical SAM protein [Pleionea sp. HL-JVS1]